jgi:hemin uptake protein HemP
MLGAAVPALHLALANANDSQYSAPMMLNALTASFTSLSGAHGSHATVQAPGLRAGDGGLPRISSEALLRGARELEIQHGDALYRLRLTAQGKLILTK